jgi:hypothetical protein
LYFTNKNLENIEPRIKKKVFKNNNKKNNKRRWSIFPSGFEPGPLADVVNLFKTKKRSNIYVIEGI